MSTKLGHFEILSELAKSATSTIYKANDPQSGQTVALKAIQLSAFGERAADLEKCLLEENETIKGLSHSNLAPVYGAGEIDGQFCAAMEYIQGNSIATMLARKEGFSIWDLLDIGRQVCSGLDHARSQNVFHFSLEPAKIMCGWDGTVRVLSYGVSSVGKFTEQISGVPTLLHYMSPEQVRGEPIDARSNLFSLGAIFYEMVTDRKAFDGEDAEFLRRSVLEGLPVPPMLVNPKVHPVLSDLIIKALAKDPAARYQNGRELLDDLEKCKEARPQPAKQAAVQTSVGAKASAASASAGTTGPKTSIAKPNQVERKVTASSAASKAAASAAGWEAAPSTSSTAVKRPVKPDARSVASMSSATLDEPGVDSSHAPRFAVDPLMAEAEPDHGGSSVSFSEMTELPPLKDDDIAPSPAPATEPQAAHSNSAKEEKVVKPKAQPREVARKAVKEVQNVPPRLIAYSAAAATALILIVALALYLHVNGLDGEGNSARPTAGAPATQAAANRPAPQTQAPQADPAAPADMPELRAFKPVEDPDTTPWVPATPGSGKNSRKRTSVPAEAPVTPGQVTIDSSPEGAQLQIDGQTDPSWVTPVTLTGLAAGQHSVTFSKPGYSSDTRTVSLVSSKPVSVTARLAQAAATLVVSSTPAGANIYVDGKNTGKLTPAQVAVEKGQHVVLVRKSGYIDDTTSAQFVVGQTVKFSPALRPLGNVDDIRTVGKMKKLFGGKEAQGMGTVSIRTQPKGAQVAVNQHMLDKDSPVDFLLDPGNYIVDITMSGYAPIHRIITVDRGAKSVIDEVLQHE